LKLKNLTKPAGEVKFSDERISRKDAKERREESFQAKQLLKHFASFL